MKTDHDVVPGVAASDVATASGSVSNQPITRRIMLTTVAASVVTAIASPSIAGESQCDARLIELGWEFELQLAAFSKANNRCTALELQFDQREPALPEVCHIRRWDKALFGRKLAAFHQSFEIGEPYRDDSLAQLRRAPVCREYRRRPTDEEKTRYGYRDSDWMLRRAVWPLAQRRADEILAAYDSWLAACEQVRSDIGLTDAHAQADDSDDTLFDVIEQITSARANTPAGRVVKAKAAAYCMERFNGPATDEIDDRIVRSMIDDILRTSEDTPPATPAASTTAPRGQKAI